MTTWANGDTITAAFMNSVEQVFALGTYGATTAPRLTVAPSTSFTLASNLVAANVVYNGSVTVSGAGKQYEGLSFRTLTSSATGSAAYATCIAGDHQATLASGAFAYSYIASLTCNTGPAGTKASGLYQRTVIGGTFAGTAVAGTFGMTYNTGASAEATSNILNIESSGTNVTAFPIGIYVTSNTPGVGGISNVMVVDSSVSVGLSCLLWNQRAGTTANFIKMANSSGVALTSIDVNGDLKFETTSHKLWNGTSAYLTMPTNGDVVIGKSGAAVGDTTGHMYIQSHAGPPTGVPAGQSGYSAMRYDTTNHKIYVYDGGWKATAALT